MRRSLKNTNNIVVMTNLIVFCFYYGLFSQNIPPSKSVVCIDPGHPSETNDGRTLQNGLRELDINWEVAIILDSLLRLEKNINVVLTKQYREQKVTNFKRALIANKNNSNIFIRLHCDTGAGSGYTIYYPDRKGCKNGYCGPSYDIIKESRIAAMIIFDSLKTLLSNALNSNGVKGDSRTFIGAKQGALTGSIFSKVPVVLVEMVFLSNKKDVLFINGYAQKLKIAKALKSGILGYLHRRE